MKLTFLQWIDIQIWFFTNYKKYKTYRYYCWLGCKKKYAYEKTINPDL